MSEKPYSEKKKNIRSAGIRICETGRECRRETGVWRGDSLFAVLQLQAADHPAQLKSESIQFSSTAQMNEESKEVGCEGIWAAQIWQTYRIQVDFILLLLVIRSIGLDTILVGFRGVRIRLGSELIEFNLIRHSNEQGWTKLRLCFWLRAFKILVFD